jgi:crossover junction endodeoxyribonuclease RusA
VPDAHTVVSLDVPREWLLTSNQRLAWRPKANRTSYLRDAAGWQARGWKAQHRKDVVTPFPQRMEATAWLRFPTARDRDPANWYPTVKAIVDGVVDAGVLVDDSTRYLLGPDMREAELRCAKGVAVQVLLVLRPA